jgi:hypothetical protein
MVLLLPLAGCTTPSQWIADAQVDELCAKDGGIKVYETVTLPKERFNEWGQFPVPSERYAKPTDEYYMVEKTTYIQGHSNGYDGNLVVYQNHYWIYRKKDQKLLGEDISYARLGGDLPLPAHSSSYRCPERNHILEKIFLKAN